MKVVQNTTPSTFFCSEPNLKIYDERRKMFYVHPNKEEHINFNLPKGRYYTPNRIYRQPKFIPYSNFVPLFQKGFFRSLKIRTGKNPNKATTFRNTKDILIDNKFANHEFAPVPVFIIAHELHHFKFYPVNDKERNDKEKMMQIEKNCDEGAVNYMLWKGYNPSQIKLAKNIVLSNKERGLCVDHLTTSPINNYRR